MISLPSRNRTVGRQIVPSPHRHLRATIAVVLLALLLGIPPVVLAQSVDASTSILNPATNDSPLFSTIKPDLRDTVADQLEAAVGDLTNYTIDVAIDAGDVPKLEGHVSVDYVNITGDALKSVPFRLYANSPDPEHDTITVSNVRLGGKAVPSKLTTDNSVLTIPLPHPLAAGGDVTISMDFAATVPVDTPEHYGIFGVDSKTGTWALAHWYPIVSGWDPSTGWEIDPTSDNGDPVFSNTSQYEVSITAPSDWEIAATGTIVQGKVTGQRKTEQVISGPVRDFAIVANSQFDSVSKVVDGTTITSWFLPGDDRVGDAVLTYASQAIALYSTLFGPYPYVDFDVVPVELYGASGVEFPQLIYLAQSYYTADQSLAVPNYLDFTVAHEVMHQWWYGLVGNNQYLHAFTDEGLTNFVSSLIYFTEEYGEDAGTKIFTQACLASFDASVTSGADQIVDTPTDAFGTTNDYVWAAYSKAPVGFEAIYDQIGEQAFVEGLSDYLKEKAFGIAQPGDMLAAFEEASGQDLSALWNHWFEERDGADDV
jgi:hypothetical protein